MGNWNFADIWEAVADELPDAQCLVHGDTRVNWRTFDQRADGVAARLLAAGLAHQQAVAVYLYNRNEYLETTFAAFKASLVPVNTNYRYTAGELRYLWDNADAGAVVFQGSFTDTIDQIRADLPQVRVWLWVDDGVGDRPDWADDYEVAATTPTGRVHPSWGRSGDDLNMLYTGGTTGMPKGVMWRQDDLVVLLSGNLPTPFDPDGTVDERRALMIEPGRIFLPACPLMHGTGNFPSLGSLCDGGSVVTLVKPAFDPVELLDTVERERVTHMSIVGDAFGKPIVAQLDAHPDRWDISSLRGIVSSGVMWSSEVKDGLLRHNPHLILLDAFSSSEALGMGASVSGGGTTAATATFALTPDSIVLGDDDRPLAPGSPEIGRLAVGGRVPVGYYKDPEKTARTFVTIDGVRYSCPGDHATIAADGTVTLLGRGSVCINTGGEKVFPEEVEETLKRQPGVADVVVVGVPDDKWGEAVVAVVEPAGERPDVTDLITSARMTLAAYKTPKHVVFVDSIQRAPNGKVDYKRLRAEAASQLNR